MLGESFLEDVGLASTASDGWSSEDCWKVGGRCCAEVTELWQCFSHVLLRGESGLHSLGLQVLHHVQIFSHWQCRNQSTVATTPLQAILWIPLTRHFDRDLDPENKRPCGSDLWRNV